MRHLTMKNQGHHNRISRRAFTLIEIMVALAIFMLLLVIILVPLNMGMNLLHLGKAQADVQSTTQQVIDRMRTDLSHAIYVYPNAVLPTVTGTEDKPKLPYGDPALIVDDGDTVPVAPYFRGDPCDAGTARVGNLTRIDMLMPQTEDGSILTPVVPGYYIVTYYARRQDISKGYQSIDNPIVLYRAQIPFRGDPSNVGTLIDDSGSAVEPAPNAPMYPGNVSLNANIYNSRYENLVACGSGSARSAAWLEESAEGEPDLEPLTDEDGASDPGDAFILYGSHVSLLPVGMGLKTDLNYKQSDAGYVVPKSTFTCTDINHDGVIDQVAINLQLQTVDDVGAQPKGQDIAMTQVVNLPNVRSFVNIR